MITSFSSDAYIWVPMRARMITSFSSDAYVWVPMRGQDDYISFRGCLCLGAYEGYIWGGQAEVTMGGGKEEEEEEEEEEERRRKGGGCAIKTRTHHREVVGIT